MSGSRVTLPLFEVPVSIIQCVDSVDGVVYGELYHYYTIEAETKQAARRELVQDPNFLRNYNLAPIDEKRKLQPFTLRKGVIKQLPSCPLMHRNIKDEFTCGRPQYIVDDNWDTNSENFSIQGEYGMCVLQGYDAPDFPKCPYNKSPFVV